MLQKKSASRETTPAAAGSSGSSNNPSASPVSAQAEDQHGQPEALSQTAAGATPSTGSPFAPYSRSDRPAVAVPAAEAAGGAGGGETVEGVGVAGGASGPSGSNTSISTSTSSGGSGATGPRLEAPADSVPDIDNVPLQQATSTAAAATDAGTLAASSLAAAGAGGGGSSSTSLPAAEAAASAAASQAAEAAAAAVIPRAPSPWTSGHNVTSVDPRVSLSAALASGSASGAAGTAAAAVGDGNDPFLATISNPVAPSPWQLAAAAGPEASAPAPAAAGAGAAAAAVEASASASRTETADAGNTNAAAVAGGSSNGASVGADPAAAATTPAPTTSSGGAAAAVAAAPAASGGDGDGWEMVSRDVPSSGKAAGGGSSSEAEALDTVRTLVESMAEDGEAGTVAVWRVVERSGVRLVWIRRLATGCNSSVSSSGCAHETGMLLRGHPATTNFILRAMFLFLLLQQPQPPWTASVRPSRLCFRQCWRCPGWRVRVCLTAPLTAHPTLSCWKQVQSVRECWLVGGSGAYVQAFGGQGHGVTRCHVLDVGHADTQGQACFGLG